MNAIRRFLSSDWATWLIPLTLAASHPWYSSRLGLESYPSPESLFWMWVNGIGMFAATMVVFLRTRNRWTKATRFIMFQQDRYPEKDPVLNQKRRWIPVTVILVFTVWLFFWKIKVYPMQLMIYAERGVEPTSALRWYAEMAAGFSLCMFLITRISSKLTYLCLKLGYWAACFLALPALALFGLVGFLSMITSALPLWLIHRCWRFNQASNARAKIRRQHEEARKARQGDRR